MAFFMEVAINDCWPNLYIDNGASEASEAIHGDRQLI